jgi:hypothetical protein
MSILLPIYASGSVTPSFGFQNHSYTSGGSSSESAVILKTDGWVYQLDGAVETQKHKWLEPPHKASYTDVSIYYLSVGMETGDTIGTWLQLGGSGGAQRKFGITSSGLTRNNTLYYSWGVRSGTTLGAFDGSVTSTIAVP